MYQHVVSGSQGDFTARALVGTRSIMLAWDHTGPAADRAGLLGFAIHRFDLTAKRDMWLAGQKRFVGQENLGINLDSNVAPFQRFRWGDYGAYPGHKYRYEIHPLGGTSTNLTLGDPIVLSLEAAKALADGFGIYSNRGVSASLAYRVKFDKPPEDLPEPKRTQAFDWLTRDIKPALLAFIRAAKQDHELRVAIYEFEDQEIRAALLKAVTDGVKVQIVYHAVPGTSDAKTNPVNLAPFAGTTARTFPRTKIGISHNKFIVHLVPGASPADPPVATRVWTGSTNFTRAGLYLQTNLGLVFESEVIAKAFSDFWSFLSTDPDKKSAKPVIAQLVTDVRASLPSGPKIHFSPVKGAELLDEAVDLIADAQDLVLISSPFGLDGKILAAVNTNPQSVIEYGLVNTTQGAMVDKLPHAQSKFSWFTTPNWLPKFDGQPWDSKPLGQHKIHTKSIVVDPFGAAPRMLVGSANFSDESVNNNDENAFLVEGDPRASAIVATEFLRMFDHYKTRAFIASLDESPDDQYLAEDGTWTIPYYQSYRLKYRERRVFAGT
jgi:phosphatidylserine/phosphatidylglycerophosphate/cardiolipin synthase-like enzyme